MSRNTVTAIVKSYQKNKTNEIITYMKDTSGYCAEDIDAMFKFYKNASRKPISYR
jgi:hypothetical protein